MSLIYSDAVHEIKPWLLQLILQKVFGLSLEFRYKIVPKTTLSDTHQPEFLYASDQNNCNESLWGQLLCLVIMPGTSPGPVHQLFQHGLQEHPTNRLPLAEGVVGRHQIL
jgi:hypothetical protein